MLYVKIEQKIKKITRCFYIEKNSDGNKLRQIKQLYLLDNNKNPKKIYSSETKPFTLGEEGSIYHEGTIVLEGHGVLYEKPGNYTFTVPESINMDSLIKHYIQATGGSGGDIEGKPGGAGGNGKIIKQSATATPVTGNGGNGGNGVDGGTDGAGGGGAAGYGGNGGNGGGTQSSQPGQKGGGSGGGAAGDSGVGGMGGCTGIFGKHTSGQTVANVTTKIGIPGKTGSINSKYSDKNYGGGSGGADEPENSVNAKDGAVLICWGEPINI